MTTVADDPMVIGGWLSERRRPLATMIATNFISLFSNQLTAIAVHWFVLTLTGSAIQTGLTAAVTLLPSVIMSFFGGAVVDRMSARKLSIFSDLISGITVLFVPVLYLMDVLNFPLLLMFLGALFDTPGSTARGTLLPRLSERAGMPLERMNSIFGVNQAMTTLFGAVTAGLLVGTLGAVNVLWLNAIAFGISALAMTLPIPELNAHPASDTSVMDDIREGIGWLWQRNALRTIIFAAVIINGVFSPIAAVALPYFAKTEFDSAIALGILMSGFGGGALIGAIAYGILGTRLPRRMQLLISLSLLSVPAIGMATLPPLWIAWLLNCVIGIGIGSVNPLVSTIIMTSTPQRMLGRVTGVFQAGAMVASPLGVLIGGPLIALAGLRGTFMFFGVVLILVLILVLANPSLHHLDEVLEPTSA